ncbi:C-4 sterol methyl oxidase [Naegleria gruberi]|uniref:C-4 sterol methyl oxidase n=1 Tax=Naegleria gruberi TaxID=5762 RepID=D2UYP0_NAEGR|nr:C-4 sterol methyl oxidase [Naegleria gruberi]EFC50510.1 C-4 sterol methyl oxidase [Naegleria gruberi]|eukprot:XP_002683254.1 C-4 sterol methyl oxidase [Naegleria gruberi strain NEG-M]
MALNNNHTSGVPEWVGNVDLNNMGLDQQFYYLIRSNFSELEITTTVSIFYIFFLYTILSLPWYFIKVFKPSFLYKYKLQQKEEEKQTDWGCILQLVINHLLILPMLYMGYPVLKWVGVSYDLALPSWWDMLARSMIFLVVEDAWFYWVHRFMHTDFGYNYIHKIHHEYQTPIGYCSSYASCVEFIILGIGSFIGPFLFGCPHIMSWWVWMTVRQIEAIDCHTGFHFPWSLCNFLPFYCGPIHHDHHHKTYNGNYASTFTWWDWMCGTDKGYRLWLEKQKKKQEKKVE